MESAEPAGTEQRQPDLVRSDAAYVAAYVDSVLSVYMAKTEWAGVARPGQDPLSNPQASLDCHPLAPCKPAQVLCEFPIRHFAVCARLNALHSWHGSCAPL